jgi:hypothetical protein
MIIVPRASPQPNLPGLPRANPGAPNAGDALAGIGAGVADLGQAVARVRAAERDRDRETALRAARVDAARELAGARAASDQDQQFEGLIDRFDAEVARIGDDIGGRFEGGARGEFDQLYSELALGHQAGVIARQATGRAGTERARIGTALDDLIVQYGAAPDDTVRGGVADQAAGVIARAQAAGLIGEQDAAAALARFGEGATQAALIRMLREDPARLKAALEGGGFASGPGAVGPVERERLIGAADGAVAARARAEAGAAARQARADLKLAVAERPDRAVDEIDGGRFDGVLAPDELAGFRIAAVTAMTDATAKEASRAEKAEAARVKEIGQRVDLAEKTLADGLPLEGLAELVADAGGTEHAPRLASVLADAEVLTGFARATPDQRQAAIAAARARAVSADPGAGEVERGLAARLEALDRTLAKGEADDLLTHLARRGLADVAPIGLGDPESLRQRRAQAVALAGAYGVDTRFLTGAERGQIRAAARTATVEDQLAIVAAFAEGFGPDAAAALGEAGFEAPAFAHAGILVVTGGDPEAARAILAGQRLLDGGTATAAPRQTRDQALAGAGVFAALPPELGAMRQALIRAADAHFAATAPGEIDKDDAGAGAEAYAASLQAAAGAVMRDGRQLGGFQEVNGLAVLLPSSLTADIAERALAAATPEDLAGASRSGQAPILAGRPLANVQGALALRYAGAGLYLAGVTVRGRFEALADDAEPGGRALIDIERLVALMGDRAAGRSRGLVDRFDRAVIDALGGGSGQGDDR